MSSSPDNKDELQPLRRSTRKSVATKLEEQVLTPRKRKSTATPLKNASEKNEIVGTPKRTRAAGTPRKSLADNQSTPKKNVAEQTPKKELKKNENTTNISPVTRRTPRKSLRTKDDPKKPSDLEGENNSHDEELSLNKRGRRKSTVSVIKKKNDKTLETTNEETLQGNDTSPPITESSGQKEDCEVGFPVSVSVKKKSRKSVHFKNEIDERHIESDDSPPFQSNSVSSEKLNFSSEESTLKSSLAVAPKFATQNFEEVMKEANLAETQLDRSTFGQLPDDTVKVACVAEPIEMNIGMESSLDNALLSPKKFLNSDDDEPNSVIVSEGTTLSNQLSKNDINLVSHSPVGKKPKEIENIVTNVELKNEDELQFKSPRRKLSYEKNTDLDYTLALCSSEETSEESDTVADDKFPKTNSDKCEGQRHNNFVENVNSAEDNRDISLQCEEKKDLPFGNCIDNRNDSTESELQISNFNKTDSPKADITSKDIDNPVTLNEHNYSGTMSENIPESRHVDNQRYPAVKIDSSQPLINKHEMQMIDADNGTKVHDKLVLVCSDNEQGIVKDKCISEGETVSEIHKNSDSSGQNNSDADVIERESGKKIECEIEGDIVLVQKNNTTCANENKKMIDNQSKIEIEVECTNELKQMSPKFDQKYSNEDIISTKKNVESLIDSEKNALINEESVNNLVADNLNEFSGVEHGTLGTNIECKDGNFSGCETSPLKLHLSFNEVSTNLNTNEDNLSPTTRESEQNAESYSTNAQDNSCDPISILSNNDKQLETISKNKLVDSNTSSFENEGGIDVDTPFAVENNKEVHISGQNDTIIDNESFCLSENTNSNIQNEENERNEHSNSEEKSISERNFKTCNLKVNIDEVTKINPIENKSDSQCNIIDEKVSQNALVEITNVSELREEKIGLTEENESDKKLVFCYQNESSNETDISKDNHEQNQLKIKNHSNIDSFSSSVINIEQNIEENSENIGIIDAVSQNQRDNISTNNTSLEHVIKSTSIKPTNETTMDFDQNQSINHELDLNHLDRSLCVGESNEKHQLEPQSSGIHSVNTTVNNLEQNSTIISSSGENSEIDKSCVQSQSDIDNDLLRNYAVSKELCKDANSENNEVCDENQSEIAHNKSDVDCSNDIDIESTFSVQNKINDSDQLLLDNQNLSEEENNKQCSKEHGVIYELVKSNSEQDLIITDNKNLIESSAEDSVKSDTGDIDTNMCKEEKNKLIELSIPCNDIVDDKSGDNVKQNVKVPVVTNDVNNVLNDSISQNISSNSDDSLNLDQKLIEEKKDGSICHKENNSDHSPSDSSKFETVLTEKESQLEENIINDEMQSVNKLDIFVAGESKLKNSPENVIHEENSVSDISVGSVQGLKGEFEHLLDVSIQKQIVTSHDENSSDNIENINDCKGPLIQDFQKNLVSGKNQNENPKLLDNIKVLQSESTHNIPLEDTNVGYHEDDVSIKPLDSNSREKQDFEKRVTGLCVENAESVTKNKLISKEEEKLKDTKILMKGTKNKYVKEKSKKEQLPIVKKVLGKRSVKNYNAVTVKKNKLVLDNESDKENNSCISVKDSSIQESKEIEKDKSSPTEKINSEGDIQSKSLADFFDFEVKENNKQCHVNFVQSLFNTTVLDENQDDEDERDWVPPLKKANKEKNISKVTKKKVTNSNTFPTKLGLFSISSTSDVGKSQFSNKNEEKHEFPETKQNDCLEKLRGFSVTNVKESKILKSQSKNIPSGFVVTELSNKVSELKLMNDFTCERLMSKVNSNAEHSGSNQTSSKSMNSTSSVIANETYFASAVLPDRLTRKEIQNAFKKVGISDIASIEFTTPTVAVLEFSNKKSFQRALKLYGLIKHKNGPIYVLKGKNCH